MPPRATPGTDADLIEELIDDEARAVFDRHVARHHADNEAVFAFEGTHSIQSLVIGRDITGISAIAPRGR